jgi:ABC-2 type transport system permease protein
MATVAITTPNLATIYWKETKYELLRSLRLRAYTFSVIGFPVMFYILFGLLINRGQTLADVSVSTYVLSTCGTFGIMGASLFGTAGALSAERGLGWLQVKRASPMPPIAYFTAKIIKGVIFSIVVVLCLLALGIAFGNVHISFTTALRLVLVLAAGSLPFCAMGLAIGYFAGPNSAPAVINMIYLPLSFCSGLWIPFMFLPKFLQQCAHFLPSYHVSQLALGVIGAGHNEPNWIHWTALVIFTALCIAVALYGERRDEGKLYG